MGTVNLPDELQKVLQTHWEKTAEICDPFADKLTGKPVPPTSYHYTDDRGLRGILETGRLWFTDLFSLNDPSELNHGISLALKILENKANESQKKEVRFFCKMFDQAMTGSAKNFAHFFVCCFSNIGDELGQWRAYADEGRGYAIGFDAQVLETAFVNASSSTSDQYSTFPVTYDDESLSTYILRWL